MLLPNLQKTQNNDCALDVQLVGKQHPSDDGVLCVLRDISFSVERGEILAVVGKSGVGKSTLLNIVSGIEEPSSGQVTRRGVVGYMPQKDLLLPWRTVLQNVLLPVEIKNEPVDQSIDVAKKLLHEVGMLSFQHAYPSELSGGMRQKTSFVRGMLQKADILLFDEAFSAVDFSARLQLTKKVRSVMRQEP
jgi:NitT/TauT family transport system ATP-binding protein